LRRKISPMSSAMPRWCQKRIRQRKRSDSGDRMGKAGAADARQEASAVMLSR
jgi:hypothetical protein